MEKRQIKIRMGEGVNWGRGFVSIAEKVVLFLIGL